MPQQTQIGRIFRILHLIEGGERCNATDLARRLGVTRRTIFRDIRTLQGAQVPLYLHESSGCYRLRRSFLNLPVHLSESETLTLVCMAGKLARATQSPMLHGVLQALEKIRGQLPPATLKRLEQLEERTRFQMAGGEDGEQCQDVYCRIEQAIQQRQVLWCRYEAAGKTPRDADPLGHRLNPFELRPYGLFWSKGASYVVGHHGGRDALRTLRLSRFTDVEVLDKNYRIPEAFSMQEFLGDAWGIVRGEQSHDVELCFSGISAEMVAESQWHRTQCTQWNKDKTLSFTCRVDGLGEIARWVLSMGPQCQVVRPEALREEVARLAEAVVRQYAR